MATYRQVHTSFWQDSFVLDLTPEEKYFYVYLLTNSKTSQCGIYELPKKIIETETGYNRETVEKLLERFIEYGKIDYCEKTKEIVVFNWLKYNSINSPKVKACIKKELGKVKNKDFVSKLYGIDSLLIEHIKGINSLNIDSGEEEEEEEQEEEKEEEKEKEEEEEPAIVQTEFKPILAELKKIKGWPYDQKKDVALIASFQNDFPGINILEEVKGMAVWLIDRPFKKNSNHRSFFRNWCKKSNNHSTLSRASPKNEKLEEEERRQSYAEYDRIVVKN